MNYEDIYLVINFETDDIADILVEQMFREKDGEDEEYPDISDDERASKLLIDEEISIDKLEGSLATIHNIDKNLYIRFDINNKVYTPTPLEYIQPLQKYIDFVTSFNTPKKVRIVDVSTQVCGIIDINYGIKFKFKITDTITESIEKEELYSSNSKDILKDEITIENMQAFLYIKTLRKISSNDDSYDDSIEEIIEKLSSFYIEGLNQINYISYNKSSDTYNILHRRETAFYFGSFNDEYYGIVFLEDRYFIYNLGEESEEVTILCETKDVNLAHIDILNYFEDIKLSL